LTAGGGVPGASSGATSNGAVMTFPQAFLGLLLGQEPAARNSFGRIS
jgi:hypothetical protein